MSHLFPCCKNTIFLVQVDISDNSEGNAIGPSVILFAIVEIKLCVTYLYKKPICYAC